MISKSLLGIRKHYRPSNGTKSATRARWFLAIGAVWSCLVALVGAVAIDESPTATGATRVLMWARGPERMLIDGLTGQPAVPPSTEEAPASAGGTLLWVVTRDAVDELGFRHVFFREHYRPAEGVMSDLPDAVASGVPLGGAELGFHYDATGALYAVAGARFDDVALVGPLQVTSADDAREAALWALQHDAGVAVMPDASLAPEIAAALLERTRIRIASRGDGSSFDYLWEAPFLRIDDMAVTAAIHGATGELLWQWNPNSSSDCEPSSSSSTVAIGKPQNTSIPNRVLWATPTSDQPGFTHEAYRGWTQEASSMLVYKGEDSDSCSWPQIQKFSVLPVKKELFTKRPVYDDYQTPETVPGRAGADAMWKTYQTMFYFDSHGWWGWDGQNAPARVVVEARCGWGWNDNALFHYTGLQHYAPEGSVAICQRGTRPYSYAACLDVVAHEFGHGVVFSSAGWSNAGPPGDELHEGFADTIAYAVEWDSEPAGSGSERAEWTAGEDNGAPRRWVDVDDGLLGLSFHADDPPGPDPHLAGNRLPVALRLASVGGFNPVCTRLHNLSGCGVDVTSIGVSEAGYILFRTLTWYTTSTDDWYSLSDLAKQAAFDLYFTSSPCYNAYSEQDSMIEAFTAIGYPGTPYRLCGCGPEC